MMILKFLLLALGIPFGIMWAVIAAVREEKKEDSGLSAFGLSVLCALMVVTVISAFA